MVADEVRGLAKRTADSTASIRDLIANLQQNASQTVDAVKGSRDKFTSSVKSIDEMAENLRLINTGIQRINDDNQDVASATEEQQQEIESVSNSLRDIETSVATGAEAASRLADASRRLDKVSEDLSELVQSFSIRR